jgi:hypothetical protein
MGARRAVVWRLLAVVCAVLAGWRLLVTGVAEYHLDNLEEDARGAAERALAWDPASPEALRVAAGHWLEQDPDRALDLARRAFLAAPTDGRALVLLANLYLARGETGLADRLAGHARTLLPTKVAVLLPLADYWDRRGRIDLALEAMGQALAVDGRLGKQLFPLLLKLAENPRTRPALAPFAASPPGWWDGFFADLARRALDREAPLALLAFRRASAVPLSLRERQAMVERLQDDGDWAGAYLLWASGLEPAQRRWLGNLFNGGFELEPIPWGFDWRLPRLPGVSAVRQSTFGGQGEVSLRLGFEGRELVFRHLYQPLFLAPGRYELRLLGRPDRLQGRGGLRWAVRCAGVEDQALGVSERFLGTSDWRRETVSFEVPADSCTAQVIRLESEGRNLFDHRLQGEIWFDGFAIRRLPPG